ncbi:MAG: Flagellar hook-length control protein FliK [Gaiellaceae bacterium]|nr:Flagellar hook-length control protein FliK [Gaiellaceae bacterium]
MEQIISTTPAPTAPATTAAVPLAVTATATAEGGAESDSAAQFSALLVAIQTGAAPVPAATAPAEEEHAETSEDDAEGAPAAATAAAATTVVPVALPVPVQQSLAPLVSISAHARGTKSVEAAVLGPVVTDAVVAADAAPAEAGTAPIITVAPATAATVTTNRVAPIVLPSSWALPDGDVDPALVEAAIAAAAETAPARPAATTTARPAVHAVDTAPDVVAERAATAEEQPTATRPATDAPVQSAAPADRHEGSSTGSGQGGRLDLQVQAAPRTGEAAPDAVETPVAVIDRERVERLAEGLAARLKVSHAADGARIRMQLEPRELGEVVVRLEIRNGMAHAHLIAESADAGTALQASLSDLRASLADRGLQLDSVSIRVAGESASSARDQAAHSQGDRRPRAPLSFGRIDEAGTIAATDQIDRAREGQAVWMLA